MAIIKKSLFCLISFFIFSFCFAYEIDLLSPKKGEWSNKQMLVINDFPNLNGDFFYSLDGSDREYAYLFKDNKWYYTECDSDWVFDRNWKLLTEEVING